jgi:hypothetical protein
MKRIDMCQTLNDIVVFISTRNSTCGECKQELGRKAWITLDRKRNALCLNCADLDHLVFLPSGDAALTRRSRKYSGLSAVVVKWCIQKFLEFLTSGSTADRRIKAADHRLR